MLNINHKKTIGVGLFALHTNGASSGATCRVKDSVGIHAHVDAPAGRDVDQALLLGGFLGQVGDEAMGRILPGAEFEIIEEIASINTF